MANILVICGAGASSSFLVHWLRKRSESRGFEHTFSAGSLEALPDAIEKADVVLVGSHLAGSVPLVEAVASTVHIPVILLPIVTFDAAGADTALDLLIATETDIPHHA